MANLRSKTMAVLAMALAGTLLATPALADKPAHAGGGKPDRQQAGPGERAQGAKSDHRDDGRKNNQQLIQPQYSPMPVGEEVAVLYCGTHGLMKDISLDQVHEFDVLFLERMRATHQTDVLDKLSAGKVDPELFNVIEDVASGVVRSILIDSGKRKMKVKKFN